MTGWALMENNIQDSDFENLINFLKTKPKLTNGEKVKQFEKEWSEWLGTKYSVFVNSGASANYLSMIVLKELLKEKNEKRDEILVCPMNWISDIASIMWSGFKPVFVDMNPRTLSIDNEKALEKITENTAGIMLTHLCGFNALTKEFHKVCQEKNIHIIEDVCESHSTIGYDGRKCGVYGEMSCFSYYYGHHITCVEGGMISTDDEKLYQMLRMYRSHGLVRECTNPEFSKQFDTPGLEYKKGFVFAYPGFNMRNTEIGGVMGSFQLKRLDEIVIKRRQNFQIFLDNLNPKKYRTDFAIEGNSNFALITILQPEFKNNIDKICIFLQENNFEYRKGMIGGNQLRQPYLKGYGNPLDYPETDYLHFHSIYIGNFPELAKERIEWLCQELNKI